MADKFLSQAEIEALTASLLSDAGIADEPAVTSNATSTASATSTATATPTALERSAKLYDFRRPDKFSKEHLRALRILHETFARLLSSVLTSYLSSATQIKLTLLEQATYDDYVQSLPTPTVIYIVGLTPLPGQALIEVNLPIARVILDRLLGGSGSSDVRSPELTDIEMALLRTLGNFIVHSLRETWVNILPLEPTIQEPVLSAEFAQFTALGETTIMLVMEVALFKVTGTISMCIPYPVLQPVMDSLSAQVWMGSSQGARLDDSTLIPGEKLNTVTLPITVELGTTDITVRDLVALREGQVLRLNNSANGSLPIRVGDSVKFLGRPGLNGRNLAVRIV